jgi:hypothetical protein
MTALHVLFDFSMASDESAGPMTVMDGLLRGWTQAHPNDRVTVFGPAMLRSRLEHCEFDLIETRIDVAPRRVLQQQIELPMRRSARATDVVIVPNLSCTLVGLGTPIIGVLHDLRHLRRPQEFSHASRLFRAVVWPASVRRMSAVVSVSDFSLREADELGFALPLERAVIPNGLDHVREDLRATAKHNTVVCVGHRGSKGLHTIPQIWATVQAALGSDRPDLVVTGVGQDRQPPLLRAMSEAGVVDGFRVTEFLPEAELFRTIAEARAVLYLSSYEGFGLVPSESTVLGTHSFVYDLEPYRERASQLSITAVPVDDVDALARELTRYLRAGRVAVVADPPATWTDAAAAYRGVAERVIVSGRGSA